MSSFLLLLLSVLRCHRLRLWSLSRPLFSLSFCLFLSLSLSLSLCLFCQCHTIQFIWGPSYSYSSYKDLQSSGMDIDGRGGRRTDGWTGRRGLGDDEKGSRTQKGKERKKKRIGGDFEEAYRQLRQCRNTSKLTYVTDLNWEEMEEEEEERS